VDSSHYLCLDVLRLSCKGASRAFCDCAILLEIWDTGGLVQTSEAIAKGSVVDVAPPQGAVPDGSVRAIVTSCKADDYGYIVEIEVDPSANWFPAGYNPPYLRPRDAA
jgi:hypothetical protein